jgi:sn-glycerol 3-phosphate transport system substrate-binding protein
MTRIRLGAAAAALASLALLAAACGGDDGGGSASDDSTGGAAVELPECPVDALESATAPVEITLWHAQVAQSGEAIDELAAAYNASQDQVVVNVEAQGSSDEELKQAYDQSISTADLPEMALLLDTQVQSLVDSGTLLPAQSCIDAEDYDTSDLVQSEVDYFSVDDVFYPGSVMPATGVLFYNRTHFEEAGLDPDDPPGTIAEIAEAAAAIDAAGVTDEPFVFSTVPFVLEYWLTGAGIPFVNEDNGRGGTTATEAAWNEPGTVEILEQLQQMNDDGLMNAIANVPGNIDQFLAMANPDASQRGSMLLETSNAATSIEAFLKGELDASSLSEDQRVLVDEDRDIDLDIDAAPWSGLEEAGRVQAGGWGFFMTNQGTPEEQAAAWDFSKFVNTVPAQQILNLVGGMDPFLISAAEDPEIQEVWETTLSGQWLAISYQQMIDGIDPAFPGPLVGPYSDMRVIERALMEDVVLDGADPQEALDAATEDLTDVLQRYEEENF